MRRGAKARACRESSLVAFGMAKLDAREKSRPRHHAINWMGSSAKDNGLCVEAWSYRKTRAVREYRIEVKLGERHIGQFTFLAAEGYPVRRPRP